MRGLALSTLLILFVLSTAPGYAAANSPRPAQSKSPDAAPYIIPEAGALDAQGNELNRSTAVWSKPECIPGLQYMPEIFR